MNGLRSTSAKYAYVEALIIGIALGICISALFFLASLGASEAFGLVARYEVVARLFSFLREVLLLMLPWPTVVIFIIVCVGSDRISRSILQILGRVKKLKIANNEIELTSEERKAIELDAQRFKSEVQAYRELTLQEASRVARRKKIREKLGMILPSDGESWGDCPIKPVINWREHIRITIHVPDFVFADRLVQLVDYVGSGTPATAGRTFSTRQGIIGKVWRGREALVNNNLLGGEPGQTEITQKKIVEIVQDWGMTEDEARSAIRYLSYFAMPIKEPLSASDSTKGVVADMIGILYLDSKQPGAFLTEKQADVDPKVLEKWLEERLDLVRLRAGIDELNKGMKAFDPGVTLAV